MSSPQVWGAWDFPVGFPSQSLSVSLLALLNLNLPCSDFICVHCGSFGSVGPQ